MPDAVGTAMRVAAKYPALKELSDSVFNHTLGARRGRSNHATRRAPTTSAGFATRTSLAGTLHGPAERGTCRMVTHMVLLPR